MNEEVGGGSNGEAVGGGSDEEEVGSCDDGGGPHPTGGEPQDHNHQVTGGHVHVHVL